MTHVKLFNYHLRWPYLILGMVELVLLVGVTYLAFYLRFDETVAVLDGMGYPWILRGVIFALVMLCCTLAMGGYETCIKESLFGMTVRTIVSFCLLGGLTLSIFYYWIPELYLGPGVFFYSVVLSLFLVVLARFLFVLMVESSQVERKILIFGAGRVANKILSALDRGGSLSAINIVGCLSAEGSEPQINETGRLLSMPEDLLQYVTAHQIDEIVIALDDRRRGRGSIFPLDELLECKARGVDVVEAIDFYERELGCIELDLLNPAWMLFADGFGYSKSRAIAKRGFDIIVSLLFLAVLWPVMLLTALAVKLDSKGPAIYKQVRVGHFGKLFQVLKFRSMGLDAEKDGQAVWAQSGDSRVTRIGKVIRNTRLDELPQLFNVLKGDMSFVGPRPERPEFVKDLAQEIPYYDMRHRVKPGLMGWAQLKYPYGASVEDASNKLRYDLYYIKNQHVLLDLMIVLQSVEVILLGKGVR